MLVEGEAAQDVINGVLAEPAGTVRLSASIPTAQSTLSTLLPEVAHVYPKVRVVLYVSDRFVDAIHERFDIVLRDHFGPLPDSALVQRRLGVQTSWLVASPEYLHAHGVPEEPAAVSRHHAVVTSPAATKWRLANEASGETQNVALQPRFAANESAVLLNAARSGLGITCLPYSFCRHDLAAGTLVRVLPDWHGGTVTTTLLMPHRRGLLPAVRAVADFLVERMSLEADVPQTRRSARAGSG